MKPLGCLLVALWAYAAPLALAAPTPGTPAKVYRTLQQAHKAGVDPFASSSRPAEATMAQPQTSSGWLWFACAAGALVVLALGLPLAARRLARQRTG